MNRIKALAKELAQLVVANHSSACKCDEEIGTYCEVDIAMQLLVELEDS